MRIGGSDGSAWKKVEDSGEARTEDAKPADAPDADVEGSEGDDGSDGGDARRDLARKLGLGVSSFFRRDDRDEGDAARQQAARANTLVKNAVAGALQGVSGFEQDSARTSRARTVTGEMPAPAQYQAQTTGTSSVQATSAPATTPEARAAQDLARSQQVPPETFRPPSSPGAPEAAFTRNVLADLERNKNDPAYVAAYCAALQKTGSVPLKPVPPGQSGPPSPSVPGTGLELLAKTIFSTGLALPSSTELQKAQATFANMLETGLDSGTLTYFTLNNYISPQTVTTPGAKPPYNPWDAVAQKMCIDPNNGYSRVDTAVAQMNAVRTDLLAAQSDVAKANEQLALELSAFGPALTPEQQQAYTTAFRNDPKYKAIFQREADATQRLTFLFDTQGRELLAGITDRKQAGAVYDGLKALANTPQASAALRFGGLLSTSPAGLKALQGRDFTNDVLAPALPNYGAELLGKPAGSVNPRAVLEPWSKLVGPGVDLNKALGHLDALGRAMASKGPGSPPASGGVHGAFDPPKGVIDGSIDLAGAFKVQNPKLATAWSAFSILYAAHGAQAATTGDAQLKNWLDATKSGAGTAEVLAQALSKSKQVQAAGFDFLGPAASGFNKLAGPLLGASVSALSFYGHLQQEGGVGTTVSLLGDAAGIVGSAWGALGAFGLVAAPEFVVAIGALGAIASGLGDMITAGEQAERLKQARTNHLSKLGIKDPLLSALVNADGERIQDLHDRFAMTPRQLQELATLAPHVTGGLYGDSLLYRGEDLGLTGAQLLKLVQTLEAQPGSQTRGQFTVQFADDVLGRIRVDRSYTHAELLAEIREKVATYGPSPEGQAFQAALEYLESL